MRNRLLSVSTIVFGGLGVLIVNLLPLIGIVVGEWNLRAILLIYWVEAVMTVLIAATKSLFAEQGSPGLQTKMEPLHELRAKRGGLQLFNRWPPIYPRNIPFALTILGLWISVGAPLSVLFLWFGGPESIFSVDILLSIAALVGMQVFEFITEYIGDNEYVDVSAQAIIQTPAQFSAVVLSVGILSTAGDSATGGVLVFLIVIIKAIISVRRFYAEHVETSILGGLPDFSRQQITRVFEMSRSDEDKIEPQPELTLPDAEVSARVSTDRRAVLLGSISTIILGVFNRFGVGSLVVPAVAVIIGDPLLIGVAMIIPLAVFGAQVLSFYFRYGTIEYQRRGESIVAYDTVLDAPQWIAPVQTAEFEVKNAVSDRLLDTGTLDITVEKIDRDIQFGPVSNIDTAVETLDLPVTQTDRPDRDLAVMGAATALALSFLVVPIGMYVSEKVAATTAIVFTVVAGPFLFIPVGLLIYAGLSRI
ncbi:DUF6498-containing protein [Haloquadratum walsbyi]|uniref:Uncharacterized protein n=1 Tax=Haloquadratum walsbyi J07HQW2 TaxID=1238425 RepID=U1PJB2_9EURY|nr:DUF6498-containing protein [Haloquadratum walsbyi]ERG93752.1 MAG: hypothetical protein J07HQW2_00186 [Haloquadratum walsbyi J07HQW2]